MDYRSFNMGTIVAILAAWVDPQRNRPVLEGIPELAPFLPQLDALYAELGRIRITDSGLSKTLKELSKRALELDSVHDRKLTGIYNMITTIMWLTEDEASVGALGHLRETLLPKGLSGVIESYLSEAGFVVMAEMKLTPDMQALLTSITYGGRTLFDDYNDWVTAGKALGVVEEQRTQLAQQNDETAVTPADVRRARVRWNRLAQVLIDILDLAPNVTEETRIRLLQPLKNAEEKARLKAKRNEESSEDDPAEEGEPDVDGEMEAIEAAQSDSASELAETPTGFAK